MNILMKFWTWLQTSQLDIPLHFFGAVAVVIVAYYIITKMAEPADKASKSFMVLYAFSISETLIIIRKILQFFIDFFVGSNLMSTESVPDDHWLFKVLGFGMSPFEQRPVFDMGEDFLLGTLGTLVAAVGLFIYIGVKNKKTTKKEKLTLSEWIKAIPHRCVTKYTVEMQKLNKQTNLADQFLWWGVRALMLHAFFTWDNRAEATLLVVNFLGTVAISIIHIMAPADSFLGRIHYRVQSLLTIMVFWGSYGGNYIFLYRFIDQFDKKLHFLSGVISVLVAYYLASEFISKKSKGRKTLISIFSATFSLMIIPIHELSEFLGDFLWGTVNQGYYGQPDPNGIFYRIFGYGAENAGVYSVFDSMNDALFAVLSTLITVVPLSVYLIIREKSKVKTDLEADKEKNTVTC